MKIDSSQVKAILFDMHHTITKKPNFNHYEIIRKILISCGHDVSGITDEKLDIGIKKMDEWILRHQKENDVHIHWGHDITDWIEPSRVLSEEIGLGNLTDEQILEIERKWKEENKKREILVEDAFETLSELKQRGYKLGLITRRYDDPTELLQDFGIYNMFSVVEWSATLGFTKPYPYQLIIAASKLGLNPIRCVYVGNFVHLDVESAKRAGMIPVLTVWGNPDEASRADNDTIVINRLSELLDIF